MNSIIGSIVQVIYWILTMALIIHYDISYKDLMFWFIVGSASIIITILKIITKES